MNPDRDDLQQDPTSQHSESTTQDSEPSNPPTAEQAATDSSSAVEWTAPHTSEQSVVDDFSGPQLEGPTFGELSAPEVGDDASDPSLDETSVSDLPQDNLTIADGDMAAGSDVSQPTAPEGQSYRQAIDRGNEPLVISRGIHRIGANDSSELVQTGDPAPQLSPSARTQPSAEIPAGNLRLRPTADGGPPLARPIVLVSLRTDELHAVVAAALKLAIDRDTKTLNQIAEQKVNFAFWQYKAEQRVLHRR